MAAHQQRINNNLWSITVHWDCLAPRFCKTNQARFRLSSQIYAMYPRCKGQLPHEMQNVRLGSLRTNSSGADIDKGAIMGRWCFGGLGGAVGDSVSCWLVNWLKSLQQSAVLQLVVVLQRCLTPVGFLACLALHKWSPTSMSRCISSNRLLLLRPEATALAMDSRCSSMICTLCYNLATLCSKSSRVSWWCTKSLGRSSRGSTSVSESINKHLWRQNSADSAPPCPLCPGCPAAESHRKF